MKKNHLVIVVVLIVAIGAAAFFGGIFYQKNKMPRFSRQFGQGQGNNNQPRDGNRQNFRPVNGEIISADEKSITVKLTDGSSKIVLLAEKTVINKAAEGVKEDLKTGEKVMVIGTQNSDGSVTAENIQLNPQFRGNL